MEGINRKHFGKGYRIGGCIQVTISSNRAGDESKAVVIEHNRKDCISKLLTDQRQRRKHEHFKRFPGLCPQDARSFDFVVNTNGNNII